MTPQTLLELADRVEAATGADREIDAAIWLACVEGATREQWSYIHKGTGRECQVDETRDAARRLVVVPFYSASLDAAISLVPEGDAFTVGQNVHHGHWVASVNYVNDDGEPQSRGCSNACRSPALALCAASLRAIAARTKGEVGASDTANNGDQL